MVRVSAFLWFNAYPAQVFMGDVGALALGAALGTVAVIIRQEFVLVIMGGLFVVEAISVMLQVGWYKRTKKTHLSDGADSSPLRTKRLERNPSRCPLLDYHHRLGIDRLEYPQNPLNLCCPNTFQTAFERAINLRRQSAPSYR